MDQCLARLKQSFSLFPPRKLLIWVVSSSIAQSHYCISNDVKAKLSKKYQGEMTLFASAFAKPMNIRARLLLFDKPNKFARFCLRSVFTFIFQSHMKVALTSHKIVRIMRDPHLIKDNAGSPCSLETNFPSARSKPISKNRP